VNEGVQGSRGPGVQRSKGPAVALGLLFAVALALVVPTRASQSPLATELDALFNDPRFARALWGVRIESLRDGRVIYTRNSDKLVVPASNMKLLTMAATAERLAGTFSLRRGWKRSARSPTARCTAI